MKLFLLIVVSIVTIISLIVLNDAFKGLEESREVIMRWDNYQSRLFTPPQMRNK